MVIKHRQGQKLYCADALSRRRQVAGDNTDTFFVEPGVLFKIAQDSGSVPRDEARHATEQSEQEPLAVQLVADSGHNFWLKVSCASEKSAATTVVGADKLCGQSQGYKNVYLEDAQMDSFCGNLGRPGRGCACPPSPVRYPFCRPCTTVSWRRTPGYAALWHGLSGITIGVGCMLT